MPRTPVNEKQDIEQYWRHSDVAHSQHNLFHEAHKKLASRSAAGGVFKFVQIHANGSSGKTWIFSDVTNAWTKDNGTASGIAAQVRDKVRAAWLLAAPASSAKINRLTLSCQDGELAESQ